MKKYMGGLIASLLVLVSPATQGFAQAQEGAVKEDIHALASTVISDYGVSSIQYAIMDKGSITLSGSAGVYDQATGAPVSKDMMYGIGSVSKMYVAAATMMLVDKKLVDLDEPLTLYIKDFQMTDERYKQITPRMLLNHSSGLYGSHYENSMLFDDADTQNHDNLLNKLRSEHLKSNPGEYSVYCNDGFMLLEILVERVSGIGYTEFLNRYVSTPLGLNSTKTPLDKFDRQQLSRAYFPGISSALPVENANVLGAGGIYSTAEEVTKFAGVLMGNQPELLSETAASAMGKHEYRNGIWVNEEKNSFNYGLGWDSVSLAPFSDYGITALSKGGDTILYHAALIALPEYDISIAALSSGGSSFYNSAFASTALLQYLQDKGVIDKIQENQTFSSPVKVAMPRELQDYSGVYGLAGEAVDVNIQQGQIEMPAQMGGLIPEQAYIYTDNGKFTSSDGSASISFVNEKNGKTYLKLNAVLTLPGLGQMSMTSYEYQKLDNNALTQKVKEKWEARDGKTYYSLDEKINSLFYLAPTVLNKTISVKEGYANATKITDEDHAVNVVEIPNMNSRDAFDLTFHESNGSEFLIIDGNDFISEDDVPLIFGGQSSLTTILPDGHARWYDIGKQSAHKTITVTTQGKGGFIVYDEVGMLVHSSITSNEYSVELPAGGKIVFGGNAGDVFQVRLDKKQ